MRQDLNPDVQEVEKQEPPMRRFFSNAVTVKLEQSDEQSNVQLVWNEESTLCPEIVVSHFDPTTSQHEVPFTDLPFHLQSPGAENKGPFQGAFRSDGNSKSRTITKSCNGKKTALQSVRELIQHRSFAKNPPEKAYGREAVPLQVLRQDIPPDIAPEGTREDTQKTLQLFGV
ncbi:hypothetical protein Baya_14367 [Bagarius yarrelli]|uniref:Uncharacterized protein n=1 Tax=Bagarius yarrelli TaxID=175774 RepID=A0A556V8Z6_BAGYA|nr:hypothetical protein Baya_14367 [Bagarius yarrelli]